MSARTKKMVISHADFDLSTISNSQNQYFWDGWTIKCFTPNNRAMMHRRGVYYNGHFGFMKKYPVTTKGTWIIS